MLMYEFVEEYNKIALFPITVDQIDSYLEEALQLVYMAGECFNGNKRHMLFVRWVYRNPKHIKSLAQRVAKEGKEKIRKEYENVTLCPTLTGAPGRQAAGHGSSRAQCFK